MIPRKLNSLDRDNLLAHLTSLKGEDRRLRFGGMVSDDYIKEYVFNSFTEDNKWFGVENETKIVAACHVSILDGQAELGCSVDKEFRGEGVAQKMFDRAVTWVRTKGIHEVYMHCLSENGAMKHIAKKNEMLVVSESGETDANMVVATPNPFVHMVDAYADRMALYDMVFKQNMKVLRSMYA